MTATPPPGQPATPAEALPAPHEAAPMPLLRAHAVIASVTAHRDQLQSEVKRLLEVVQALDDTAMSVWLHGDWRWLTRNMTAEQRDTFADAVDRARTRLHAGEAEPVFPVDRWWRGDAGDRPVEPTAESAPEPATSEQWRAAYDAKVQDFAKETARSSALASHLLAVLDAVDAVAEKAVPAWSPLGVGVTKPGWEALLATARQARVELDAARTTDPGPAAPTTYALPAEPPPEVTELWDSEGERWKRRGRRWVCSGEPAYWDRLLHDYGPLSTVPPAGTGADQ